MNKLKCSLGDYLRYDRDQDFLLIDPQWTFRPTIAFIEITMKVLTFKYHDRGDLRMMIHSYRWKQHVPSDQRDQILQSVNQSRSVRKGRAS